MQKNRVFFENILFLKMIYSIIIDKESRCYLMKKKDIYLVFRFTGDNEIGIEEFSKFLDNTSKYLYSVK